MQYNLIIAQCTKKQAKNPRFYAVYAVFVVYIAQYNKLYIAIDNCIIYHIRHKKHFLRGDFMSEKRTAEEILKARYKAQNDYNKENYERIAVMAPKGTKERIKAIGEKSINSFVIASLLRALDDREKGVDGPQDQDEKPTQKPQAVTDQEPTPDAVQALIDEKRKQYEREKQAEIAQENAEKVRVFNMSDYK